MLELLLSRPNSSLRPGGTGLGEKKTNTVHHKRDSKLEELHIIPPREGYSATGSSRNGGGGGGNGHGGRVQSIKNDAVIDLDLSDDSTPLSETLQERLDLSLVLGEFQGKYNENEDDEGGSPPFSDDNKEGRKDARIPEQKITIFAFRLALLEKTASGLGTMAFVWATVVILGGFASTVSLTDFVVVTVIILAETSRIFSRSHELEWQQLSSKSANGLGLNGILNNVRSLGGIGQSSKHGGNIQPSTHVRRAKSAPSRFFGENRSPSPDSDVTPTNSSSTTSRFNRGKPGATVPVTDAIPLRSKTLDLPSRKLSPQAVPLVPIFNGVLTNKLVSRVLYFAQIVSAVVTIGLSLWRLSSQKFYPSGGNSPASAPTPDGSAPSSMANVDVSMNVFYVLAVFEGGLFLLERSYWEYKMRSQKLIDQLCCDDSLGKENKDIVNQFFYDVYEQSLKGSVFDTLDKDLVQYSISRLQTEVLKQQLGGAKMLNHLVSTKDGKLGRRNGTTSDALRSLGTTPHIIERLVEMLSWGSKQEEELLCEISSIICRLVVYNRNCARFVAVPGAMDGVVSLLPHDASATAPIPGSKTAASPLYLRLMGLRILKYLCKDHKNSLKIGETRGLMSMLVLFIDVRGEATFRFHDNVYGIARKDHLKTFKKSLQVLLLLASATNTSGGLLRKRIAKIVSGLKNLRDILEFGTEQPELQWLSIDVLYHLAMEDDVREMIGATGGVIRILFRLFAEYHLWCEGGLAETPERKKVREERRLASVKAGDTLTRLVLQNQHNCEKLLELKNDNKEKILVPDLVKAVAGEHDQIYSSAAHILRSVMKYADQSTKKEIATKTARVVVKKIYIRTGSLARSEMYETSLGLFARILEHLDAEVYGQILKTLNKAEFVKQLMKNLQHTPSTSKYPRIRRFSVELILALIDKDDEFFDILKRHNLDLRDTLENSLDSISEVENFCLFSGLVGYTDHSERIESLVKRAIGKVDEYDARTASTENPDPPAT